METKSSSRLRPELRVALPSRAQQSDEALTRGAVGQVSEEGSVQGLHQPSIAGTGASQGGGDGANEEGESALERYHRLFRGEPLEFFQDSSFNRDEQGFLLSAGGAHQGEAGAGRAQARPDEADESEERRDPLSSNARGLDGEPLAETEIRELETLKARDREVRAHEQAHVAAGGQYIRGGIKYDYQQGPDGKRYAVGGHVNIDLSEAATPEQTVQKMRQVRRAALAPAEPSSADRSVAASASQREREAQAEIQELAAEERKTTRQHQALESKSPEEGQQEDQSEHPIDTREKDLSPQSPLKKRRLTPSPNRGKIWR
ncbi:MAG: putative metalloprotease CJM1_0395 family protein [Myxococcota bacterium]|nr:putative metalloprotease CJM1_0395 family protein [Myxococcota bacterium]